MSYAEEISDHRAALRRIDLALTAVQVGVDSTEAAILVGRARADVRAAEHQLAKATRERLDAPTTQPAIGASR